MADLRNIVLIGFMGAGKTVVGKALAAVLHRPLFDTDVMVEEEVGVTIDAIFDSLGEDAFREIETSTILGLAEIKGAIISTGGGAIKNPENVKALKDGNFVIYLHASPAILFGRISSSDHRPLGKPMQDVNDLAIMLAEREPLYRTAADLVIDTDDKPLQSVEHEIFQAIGY